MNFESMPPLKLCLRVTIAALMVAACSPAGIAEEPRAGQTQMAESGGHPVSGLQVVPLTVKSADMVHSFAVEVAATAEEQAQGLMHRTELGPNDGMIFPRTPARQASFWMKNTVIPLDIIFVGDDGKILNIAANTTPLSLDPVESAGPVVLVFEIAGGRAAELGIEAGDLVEWQQ